MVGNAIAGLSFDIVLTTKVDRPMSDERNHQGSSRHWLVTALDNSLRHINADYINREIAGRKSFL